MEAAVDYKQYGKLDAMKDIIDSRGNDKLTKKIPLAITITIRE